MLTAPAASKWRVADSERLSGTSPGVSARAIAATGTFTQRTHSQPSPSVRMPPSRTPAAPAEPATAPQAPRALLRSAPSLNRVVTMERAAGETNAAPRPCAARAAISWPCVAAKPAAREAIPTIARPAMKMRRRPRRSAARPPSSRKPPNAITYALTIQGRFSSEKSSPLPMLGRATLTIDASRTTMNCATQSRIDAVQRFSRYSWAVVIPLLLSRSGMLCLSLSSRWSGVRRCLR